MSGHDRVRRQYEVARGSGSSCRGWQSSQLRGRRRRSTGEMAAAAAPASAAAETAEANNKNKNCHFREHAPKRSPLFACCSPKPATRSVFQCLVRWMARLCGRVLLGTGSSSEWSPHWTPTGASTRCCFCAVALKHVVFCRPSVRIGTCGTWARPHIFLRKGTPMKQTGAALSARASAAARSRRARGSICTASGTAEGSRPLVSQAPRPHDTAR